MRFFFRPLTLLMLFSFCAGTGEVCCAAEKASSVRVEGRVLKAKVKIGDEVRMLLKVEHPRKFTLLPLDSKMKLEPFEIKAIEPTPVVRGQNRVEETFRMTLIPFDVGSLNIPPIPVRYRDAEGSEQIAYSEPVAVQVVSVGKKLTDKDDIRAIKGPAPSQLFRFWTGVASIMAALLLAVLIALVTRRLLRERGSAESRKPAHERVKIEIARLKDQGFLEERKFKEYYSELSTILRRYFERRYQLPALEETTTEFLSVLEQKSFEREIIRKTERVLTEADLVKFAKAAPTPELAGQLEAALLEIVEATKPEDKKK